MTLTRLNLRPRARRSSLENPNIPLSNPTAALMEALGAGPTTAGVVVTHQKAMTLSAVYACVRILAESLASLPLVTYERLGRGKQRAPAHPVYRLLHDRPNPHMTPFQFIETMQGHVALTGNAYAEIEWNGRGQPIGLWPITPDRVTVLRENGRKLYRVALPDGTRVTLSEGQVLHIPGLGYDGLIGYNPIALMRQTLSVALAAEEFGARFYGNGSRPGGILTYPNKLSKEAKARLKESWESMHGGLTNSHRLAVLEEGMQWQQIQINPDDAQFLETRKFQIAEVARIYRVPPHMVGDLEKATFSNIEQQSLEFVIHTLRPWAVRWEQVVSFELFADAPQGRYFPEFLMDALLRGDMVSRYNSYAIGRVNGWLSANDIRDLENMNPLPGTQGDIYLVPLNSAPADQVGNPAKQKPANLDDDPEDTDGTSDTPDDEEPAERMQRLGAAVESVFADATDRIAKREAVMAERAAKKGGELRDHLDEDHEATVTRILGPAIRTLVFLGLGVTESSAIVDPVVNNVITTVATERLRALRSGETPPTPLSTALTALLAHHHAITHLRLAA